jgi:membrane-associated phospholipid phosphatase
VFPSGHLAVATAAALTVVLVLRVVPVAPRVRLVGDWLAVGFVLAIAVARLVETVHSLTDLLGGGATGLVVTLGAASAITAWSRSAGP